MPINETTPNPSKTDGILIEGSKGGDRNTRSMVTASDWLPSLIQAIDECEKLSKGWDSYEAEPPGMSAVSNAKQVVTQCWANSFKPTKVLPSAEGGIGIIFESPEKYSDIECFNTGEMLAVISDRKSDSEVWKIDPNSIEEALEKIRGFLGR